MAAADRRLIEQASEFYAELSHFIDFEQRRQIQATPPTHGWWYLDVLARWPHPSLTSGQVRVTS